MKALESISLGITTRPGRYVQPHHPTWPLRTATPPDLDATYSYTTRPGRYVQPHHPTGIRDTPTRMSDRDRNNTTQRQSQKQHTSKGMRDKDNTVRQE